MSRPAFCWPRIPGFFPASITSLAPPSGRWLRRIRIPWCQCIISTRWHLRFVEGAWFLDVFGLFSQREIGFKVTWKVADFPNGRSKVKHDESYRKHLCSPRSSCEFCCCFFGWFEGDFCWNHVWNHVPPFFRRYFLIMLTINGQEGAIRSYN